jgi:hypothetical protein
MAMAVVGLAWTRPPATLGWRPFTAQAASAVAGCPGPMFNTYVDGGALTWFVPSQPVFIDNRQDPYPMELLEASRRTELEGEHALLFERYGFRCAVLPPSSPIASGLARDPSWSLAYEDETWVVFERAPDRP